jgi:chromate transport protein ChrA
MKVPIVILASCIILEAVASIFWEYNDKSVFAQTIRVLRIVIGGLIIWFACL